MEKKVETLVPDDLEAAKQELLRDLPLDRLPGRSGLAILEQFAGKVPDLLDWYLTTALEDTSLSTERRAMMTERILALMARLEDQQVRVLGSQAVQKLFDPKNEVDVDRPPETLEEILLLEQEAERLRANRIHGYEERVLEMVEQQATVRAEALTGVVQQGGNENVRTEESIHEEEPGEEPGEEDQPFAEDPGADEGAYPG